MNATTARPQPSTCLPTSTVVTYLIWCRAAVWALCIGGLAMGGFVAQAEQIRSAKWTVLGGLPGWPEIWGLTLMVAGALALIGRMIGRRKVVGPIDGNDLASAAMVGMAVWYVLFASSLILGTAEYGFAPYLTLGALHGVFAVLVRRTDGFRP